MMRGGRDDKGGEGEMTGEGGKECCGRTLLPKTYRLQACRTSYNPQCTPILFSSRMHAHNNRAYHTMYACIRLGI